MKSLLVRNFNVCLAKQRWKPNCRFLTTNDVPKSGGHNKGLFQFAQADSKSYIKVLGPDAPSFLNGLVMSKLLPHYIKKNLTTINPNELQEPETVPQFDSSKGNWGAYVESGDSGPYITRFGVYTGLLNSKGKLVSDTIIYPTPLVGSADPRVNKYPTYLLEFDDSIVDKIENNFNVHKLASRVKVKKMNVDVYKSWDILLTLPNIPKDVSNPWVINLLNPATTTKTAEAALDCARGITSTLFHTNENKIEALNIERRTETELDRDGSFPLVLRVVTKSDVNDISLLFNPIGLPMSFELEKRDPQFFRRARFKVGYVDSTRDFSPESVLPLELNFDYLPNAVSADKGCYVGQELTARTLATGVLRKRLVPVTLTDLSENQDLMKDGYPEIKIKDSLEPADEIEDSKESSNPFDKTSTISRKPRRQRPAGMLIAHEGNRGVALLRVEHFRKAFNGKHNPDMFYIQSPAGPNNCIGVAPCRPSWLALLGSQ